MVVEEKIEMEGKKNMRPSALMAGRISLILRLLSAYMALTLYGPSLNPIYLFRTNFLIDMTDHVPSLGSRDLL